MNMIHDLPEALGVGSEGKWNAFCSAAKQASLNLPENPALLSELHRVWAFSDFVSKNSIQHPEVLIDLIESGDLHQKYASHTYPKKIEGAVSETDDDEALGRSIRQVRCREMVRIAWRDLAGIADLSETMGDLSDFADACIDSVLSHIYRQQCSEFGAPLDGNGEQQNMVVVGMGKLGGKELNFSSDVDLVFAFPESGHTTGGKTAMDNETFFSRLCRRLIKIVGSTTEAGLVFRVDMRLRPYGESGPIVMSFDNMVQYYERQGRDWERYAWIKARIVAGDKAAGRHLIRRLKPFIYRRYLDYGAFESLREMKEKISREVKRKGLKGNIKIGPGGIREVEFFGQIFQMIRGGVAPELQERRIQKVLHILARENYIPQEVSNELHEAYRFLRITEHRLQEASDRQTHTLPVDPTERSRLATSMGFSHWSSFFSRLSEHMDRIHFHFNALLETKDSKKQDGQTEDELRDIWSGSGDPAHGSKILSAVGFERPSNVLRLLESLREDPSTRALSADGRELLDRLIPQILMDIGRSEFPDQNLNRILDLIKTIQRRTCYLALLLENPEALIHLVKLVNASPWIVTYLTLHPVVLDELLDPRNLYHPPDRDALESEIRKKMRLIPDQDLEYQIEELCVFKQMNTLRVAAADVTGMLPLMRVSDHLSNIAETILDEVFRLAWQDLSVKFGEPTCSSGSNHVEQGFVVIAYGKLGGLELGYDSDLDMVFLHTAAAGQTKGGARSIDNTLFFSRLGQRMVHILTTHTAAGFLYETDMRLRPSGGSGPLVSHIHGYRDYQMHKAWIWEHQALVRARAVCGNSHLRDHFNRIRQAVLIKPRQKNALQKDVVGMRKRLRKELLSSDPGDFDLRQGAGGMVDIEFLVQYLVLLNAHRYPMLTEWSDNVRQIQTLAETGIIEDESAHMLKEAYLTYRSALHRLTLQEKPARVTDTKFRDLRNSVTKEWYRYFNSESGRG